MTLKIMSPCYLIAEIGINHNGDLNIAKKLILLSHQAGFDAVKFQKRTIDLVYSKDYLDTHRESPWGSTQRAQKEGLEFSLSDYWEIDATCKRIGIDWFVSCWDLESQSQMRVFKTSYNKVASAMAVNIDFLKFVAKECKPTFLSTGMCTLDDIRTAVTIFQNESCPITLLHTVSSYPAEESDLNLLCIKTLRDEFSLNVGYSGHESGVSPSVMAVVLGATVVERHVTLDRSMYGSDQAASLEPNGMRMLVSSIRKVDKCLGDGIKRILPDEFSIAKKLRYWVEP